MSTTDNMDIDINDDDSILTPLESGDTPTLPADEEPTIQALTEAKDEATYNHVLATIPREHKIKVKGIQYIRYEPYRKKKSKKTAWYWNPDQAEELIRVTPGISPLFIINS